MTPGGTQHDARVPGGLGSLVLLWVASVPVRAEQPPATPAGSLECNRVIAEVLSERVPESGETRDAAVARIVELGREVVPEVCSVLFRRELELEGSSRRVAIDRSAEALLVDVLRAWPSELVVGHVIEGADGRPLADQLLAVRLVGKLGNAETLDPFLGLLDRMDPADRQHAVARDAVEEAFAGVLRRDARAYRRLRAGLRRLDPAHLESFARALGTVGSGAGIDLLGEIMGRSASLDLAALDALGHMRRFQPETMEGRPADVVVFHLASLDPRIRRQAAISLGRLRDTDSVHLLIDMLGDMDGRARQGALWALREITGLRLPADRDRWARYQDDEMEWFATEAAALADRAAHGDTYTSVDALRVISSHPLFRSELSAAIVPALGHEEETAAVAACTALVRLDAPIGVAVLIATLADPRDAVRDAAHMGLLSMTGGELAADPEAWRGWVAR